VIVGDLSPPRPSDLPTGGVRHEHRIVDHAAPLSLPLTRYQSRNVATNWHNLPIGPSTPQHAPLDSPPSIEDDSQEYGVTPADSNNFRDLGPNGYALVPEVPQPSRPQGGNTSDMVLAVTNNPGLACSTPSCDMQLGATISFMSTLPPTYDCPSDKMRWDSKADAQCLVAAAPQVPWLEYQNSKDPQPFRNITASFGGYSTSAGSAIPIRPAPPRRPRRHSYGALTHRRLSGGFSIPSPSGHGPSASPGGIACNTKRGRRVGPLSGEQRRQAARHRKEKSVCIRCRKDKQPVSSPQHLIDISNKISVRVAFHVRAALLWAIRQPGGNPA
jgi:hypothetical protein